MKKKILKSCLALIPCMCMSFGLFACDKHSHTYASDWTYDSTSHWHSATCEHSDEITDKSAHAYGDDNICDVCAFHNVKFTYDLSSDGSYYIVTGMEEMTAKIISIPSTYNNKPVKEVGECAFVVKTGDLSDPYDYNTNLEEVVIPEGVTKLGAIAFNLCRELEYVSLPSTLKVIDDGCFGACYKLSNINLPSGLTTIGRQAFDTAQKLTNIDIPSSVTTLGEYAFVRSGLKNVTIPSSIITIEEGVFSECDDLESVQLPNTITLIGKEAFSYCTNLKNVQLPESLTTIGTEAFYECTSLTSVIFPNGVKVIRRSAFENCSSIVSIILPTTIETIDDLAFRDCDALNKVYYMGILEQWYQVFVDGGNSNFEDENHVYFYSETQPASAGNYWHYENNDIVIWS